MAARVKRISQDQRTKNLIKARALEYRLYLCGMGKIELTDAQIKAIVAFKRAYIPDLKQVDMTIDMNARVEVGIVRLDEIEKHDSIAAFPKSA